jgi:hypothetical protein
VVFPIQSQSCSPGSLLLYPKESSTLWLANGSPTETSVNIIKKDVLFLDGVLGPPHYLIKIANATTNIGLHRSLHLEEHLCSKYHLKRDFGCVRSSKVLQTESEMILKEGQGFEVSELVEVAKRLC